MPKYRKKPVVIEAEEWPDAHTVEEWAMKKVFHRTLLSPDHPAHQIAREKGFHKHADWAWVATREGGHIAELGDYIITGVEGERYPCKPSIFHKTYEPVEEADDG